MSAKVTDCKSSVLYLCRMAAGAIHFFKDGVKFRLQNAGALKDWISHCFRHHKISILNINYIFCSDKYLLKLNKDFLQHDYFTDVITFDNSKQTGKKEADIFVSIDRVYANSKKYNTIFQDELHRVMIHGALHLIGFSDKNANAQKRIRNEEDIWLTKRRFVQK